jgi:outer membrane protein
MTRCIQIKVVRSTLWLFMLAVFLAPCVAGAEDNMTLQDAVSIGLRNNFEIQIAHNSAEAARNDTGKGTAGFLPTLDSLGNFGYDTTSYHGSTAPPGGDQDYRTYGSQLGLQWTLFDGFRMFADNRRYQELALQGEEQARDIIETTVVSIMRSYFDLVRQEQLLDVAIKNIDISQARLDREEVRRSLGGASSTDLLNARVNFNTDQTLLLEQELRVNIARKELNVLLVREADEPLNVKKEIAVPLLELSLPELQQRSLDASATLQVARHRMLAVEEQVKIADSSFWPQLILGGQYGYTNRSLRDGGGGATSLYGDSRTRDAAATLQLRFNLFNGNVDRINAQNARLSAKSAVLSLADIQKRIFGFMYELQKTFLKQVAVVDIETQNTVTAKQNMQLQKERYKTGAADSLDFRDAQVNVLRALSSLINARYQARIAFLDIQRLIGEISIN